MSKNLVKILDNGKVDSVYSSPAPASGYDDWLEVETLPNLSDYWDGEAFVSIGDSPSTHHIFDYTTKLYRDWETDRKSTRLNSSHSAKSRMPSSA